MWREPIRRRTEDLLRDFVSRADELVRAQDQMQGLLGAVVSLTEDLSLEAVLDRVVQSACELVGARYGALGVLNDDQELGHFITVGIDDEACAWTAICPRAGFSAISSASPRPCGWTASVHIEGPAALHPTLLR
ncbi:hypoxia sensor histidine kinase response regulator DosT [Arthrobacter sp. Hiyo6]|nr:hypoxia sensor histidine kinase response regulator DosT [Arthrobacter sp. Hiyo6]